MRRVAPTLACLLLLTLPACASEPEPTGPTGVTVFLDNEVTAEQKTVVEQRLRSMPSVDEVMLETRDQAYERSKEMMKDRPELLAAMRPEHMPESFRASVTDPTIAEAVELAMAGVDGVDEVTLGSTEMDPPPSRIGVVVALETAIGGDRRAAVEDAVRALPQADSVAYEDGDAAYERLRRRCEGNGELVAQLDPELARPSLRFQLQVEGKAPGLAELLELDGVDGLRVVPVSAL
ncbi:permease-like cell division protein FtsX [Micromonospora costi]|uniref:permease-like cell division protein FtsX n=1 Tax=Micromonospora costi TaxID=1530042 RepID=UPI0033C938FD